MDGNNLDELRELVGFLKANGISEFEMERTDLKVRLKFEGNELPPAAVDYARLSQMMAASSGHIPAAPVVPVAVQETVYAESLVAATAEPDVHEVKSPIVGTFYESPSPGAQAFVKIGDEVEVGQVLCIIEAMKLMNEIESDVAGEVVRRIATSGQPVEYGQALFSIRPR